MSGAVAGGKGSALDRLIALDAPVPATGVVTTDAYRRFITGPTIRDFLEDLRNQDIPEPAEFAASRAQVDAAFLSAPLPSEVAAAIDALVASFDGPGVFAVRSSATAEDMAGASFAGQYESYLNVEPDGVHDAVRKVWASLWYPSPRSYRRFRRIDDEGLAMAVVVMEMLDPSIAGVLFTKDPGGRADAMRVEVVQGLGEQLVSGAVTPDAHVVDRSDLEAGFAAIAPPLANLAREAVRLEGALGAPQDIEFAVDHDTCFIVQARPITTDTATDARDDHFDFSCGVTTTYTTAGIAEMLPGVLPPLVWGIDSWLIENGFRSLFDLLGGDAAELTDGHALIGRFNGRAALNLDAMRTAAGSIPGGSPEELEQQYFGAVVKSDDDNRRTDDALHRSGASKARQGVRVLRARRRAAEHAEVAVQTVARLVEREPDLATFDDASLLAYWNRLLHAAEIVAVAEVTVAAMASASYRGVEVFLSRYLDASSAGEWARAVTAHPAGQRRARIAMAVETIVERLATDERFAGIAVEDWETTRERLLAVDQGSQLVDALHLAWRQAGSTGVFAGPTWDEVPQLAWLAAYQQLDHFGNVEPADPVATRSQRRAELEAKLTARPTWRAARLATQQIFDVRRRFFHRQADEAAEFLDRREATKAAYLQLGGLVRRCHIEFGHRLMAAGRLDAPLDVEFVGISELAAMFADGGPTLQTIAHRRQLDEVERQSPAPPLVWVGSPTLAPPPTVTGECFEGWAASPGRYEGRARLVTSPGSSAFCRGEVLVAETTDASWTPLFLAAGAIVVEQGGPLSHAAIVARELGLPTVVNVPGFVERMHREGGSAPVVVDGTAGVVTIRSGEADRAPTARTDGTTDNTSGRASDHTSAHIPDADVRVTEKTPTKTTQSANHRRSSPISGGGFGASAYVPARIVDRRWDDKSMRFNVFVAGLMGAGALMSAIVGLTESISSTQGRARIRRQATPTAQMLADGVIDGFDAIESSDDGLHTRRWYAAVAAAFAFVGVAITARSVALYVGNDLGPVGLALTISSGVALVAGGFVVGFAAWRWPRVPAIVRRLMPGYPSNPESIYAAIPRRARVAIAVMVGLVTAGALFVVFAQSWVLAIDRPLYFDVLHAGRHANRFGPDWFNQFGYAPFLIGAPTVVFVITWVRCRAVAIAYPIMIASGGALFLMINWTVHRLRPPLSVRAGQHTSYPGGHSIQVTLVLLAIPLVVWVLTDSRVLRAIGTVVPVATWAVEFVDNLRVGAHWPIDQLAGLLIALCLLTVVYSVGIDALHRREHPDAADSSITSPPRRNHDDRLVRSVGSHVRSNSSS